MSQQVEVYRKLNFHKLGSPTVAAAFTCNATAPSYKVGVAYESSTYVIDGYGLSLATGYSASASNRFYGIDINADTGSTNITGDTMVGAIRGRTVIGTTQTNASIYGVHGNIDVKASTNLTSGNFAGVYGVVDFYGASTFAGAVPHVAAGIFTIWNEGTTTLNSAGGSLCGIDIIMNGSSTNTSGINAAIQIRGSGTWDYGIYAATGTMTRVMDVTCAGIGHDQSCLKVDATQAAGHNEYGIAGYFNANYSGVMTATYLYGFGTWLNLATSFDGAAVYGVVAAQDNGIYASTLTECATTDLIYGMRAECITGASVHGLYAFSLNAPAATTAAHRAIFYSDNVESVGYAVTNRSVQAGSLKLAYINGSGASDVYYVNLYSS